LVLLTRLQKRFWLSGRTGQGRCSESQHSPLEGGHNRQGVRSRHTSHGA
jgi:hypothetical protein